MFIVTPQQYPSEFVVELVKDYPNVKLDGDIILDATHKVEAKRCPICGYPLQLSKESGIPIPIHNTPKRTVSRLYVHKTA